MIEKHGDEGTVKSLLEKHFINEKAFQYMEEDDFDSFISQREETIKNHIISKLGIDDDVDLTGEETRMEEITLSEKQRKLHDCLVEMIERDTDLLLDAVEESGIWFASKDFNFLPEGSHTRIESRRMLMLVISNNPRGIDLTSYIGPGPEEIRMRLHEIVLGNLDFFSAARNKMWLGKGKNWSTIYKKRWLRAKEYEQEGVGDIRGLLEKRLARFKETDLPKMVELFRKSLPKELLD